MTCIRYYFFVIKLIKLTQRKDKNTFTIASITLYNFEMSDKMAQVDL